MSPKRTIFENSERTATRWFWGVFIVIAAFMVCGGCSRQASEEEVDQEEGRILTLFNWEEYIGSETLDNFYKATGIRVIEEYYEDEEYMLGALQSDSGRYDIIIASDDTLRELYTAKMLSPVDWELIPNLKHLKPDFLNLYFDPEQKYTVPYLWGTTGLLINTSYIEEETDSWGVLFNPRYAGKIAMLNNGFEVIAVANKINGVSINSTDPEELKKSESLLQSQKSIIEGYFDIETIQRMMIEEELWAAHVYSGEGLLASDKNENLQYVIPEEGGPMWLDCFAIARDSLNKEVSHSFLNYILDPEVNAAIASELWYATANETAEQYMDGEVLESESVYPSLETLERCEYFIDLGEATKLYNTIWNGLQR